MKKNMGSSDRLLRLVAAAVIGYLYYNGTISGNLGIGLLVVAGIFALTSLVSVCPAYLPFGWSTCTNKKTA